MEEGAGTLLNVGCGGIKWPGWIGVDLDERADLHADIKALPFPDDSADAIAAIHVVEHFHAWEAGPLLSEWRRVLKPGGKLILELPCMDKVYDYIAMCVNHGAKVPDFTGLFVFWGNPKYKNPLMVHKYGYSKDSIVELLASCGFRDIAIEEPRYHFAMRDMRAVGYK